MNTNQIARIAGLVGEPARAAMLLELMDNRSLTAQELARAGNVTAQTASKHLAQLVEGGLLTVEQRGRHRFHCLATPDVAKVLEGIMQLATQESANPRRLVVTGPRDESMRMARTCYDHIAGRLGVAIAARLVEQGAVELDHESGRLTASAPQVLARWGISIDEPLQPTMRSARPHCRPCLDWSERRLHLAGRLGAQLCQHCLDQGWLLKGSGTRALAITPKGVVNLQGLLGRPTWDRVAQGVQR
ncbi:MAG: helix-turn-helix transcriptional regulator [Hyphomonadaceae bacterium]